MKEQEQKVRLATHGAGEVKLIGLSNDEVDSFIGMTLGVRWVRVVSGRLESTSAYLELPDPTDDEEMLPFWRRPHGGEVQLQVAETEELSKYTSPSFSIQSLCGYEYSPSFYRKESEKLKSYGFICLRSERGLDGRFWEIWYLPGIWCARGDLAETVRFLEGKEKTKAAIDFLCQHVSFGTLDVSAQRAAMVLD